MTPATEKQKAYLRVLAQQNQTQVPNFDGMSKAQARSEIGRLKTKKESDRIEREIRAKQNRRRFERLVKEGREA